MSKGHYLDEMFGLVQIAKLNGQESVDDVLAMDRYVRFVDLMRVLNLDPNLVRSAFFRARRQGVDIDAKYGIYRKGGKQPHMYVKPSQFARWLAEFEQLKLKTPFAKLPPDLSEAEFIGLTGVFKLADILRTGYIPLNRNRIFNACKTTPPEECGMWKEGGLVLCRFEDFLPWTISQMRDMTLPEARKVFADTKKKALKSRAPGQRAPK